MVAGARKFRVSSGVELAGSHDEARDLQAYLQNKNLANEKVPTL